jgi:uncharacterized protein (DUF1778 family)
MIVTTSITKEQKEWVARAATVAGISQSAFIRQAVLRAGSAALGEDPPVKQTAGNRVAEAAASLGLTEKQFRKYAVAVATGADPTEALVKLKK